MDAAGAPVRSGRPTGGRRATTAARIATTTRAPRHDDPDIPDEVEAKQLDKVARAELKTLSKDNADWVARTW